MITVVDLFCGCGGSAIGIERVPNTNIVLAVDVWDAAIQSYNANMKHKVAELMDINEINKDWLDKRLKKTPVDIVIGGPPCQGFTAVTRHKWVNNINKESMTHKNYLFQSFLNIVDILQPKVVIMENVKGILTIKNEYGERILDEIIKAYNQIGYFVKYQIVAIHDLGLPQVRNRVIFFATKDKNLLDKLKYPSENKFKNNCISNAIMDLPKDIKDTNYSLDYNSCSEYIKSLRDENSILSNHFTSKQKPNTTKRIEQIKPGQNMKKLEKDNPYKTKGKFSNSYCRQFGTELLTTLVNISKNLYIHPTGNRIYTVREALRLQGFPDSYVFDKNNISAAKMYQMIANSIPPILTENIFKTNLNVFTEISKKP